MGDPIKDFYEGVVKEKNLFSDLTSFKTFLNDPSNAKDFYNSFIKQGGYFSDEKSYSDFFGFKKKESSQPSSTSSPNFTGDQSRFQTPWDQTTKKPTDKSNQWVQAPSQSRYVSPYELEVSKPATNDFAVVETAVSEFAKYDNKAKSVKEMAGKQTAFSLKHGEPEYISSFPGKRNPDGSYTPENDPLWNEKRNAAKTSVEKNNSVIKKAADDIIQQGGGLTAFISDTDKHTFRKDKAIDLTHPYVTQKGGDNFSSDIVVNEIQKRVEANRDAGVFQGFLKEEYTKSGVDFGKYQEAFLNQTVQPKLKAMKDVEKERDNEINKLAEVYKQQAAPLGDQYKAGVKAIQEAYSAQSISKEDAEKQLNELNIDYKMAGDELFKNYKKSGQNIMTKLSAKYKRIYQEAETLEKSSQEYQTLVASLPESERKKVEESFKNAEARMGTYRNEINKTIDKSIASVSTSGYIGKIVTNTWNSWAADMGDYMSMHDIDGSITRWAQGRRTAAGETQLGQFEWKHDPMMKAISTVVPSLVHPSTIVGVASAWATGGLGLPGIVTTLAGGTLAFEMETKEQAGQNANIAMERTGDITQAIEAGNKTEEALQMLRPLYFLGIVGDRLMLKGKTAKKLVGLGIEMLEEYPTEIKQQYEQYKVAGGDKNITAFVKDNPEMLVDIGVGVLGQGGAMSGAGKIITTIQQNTPSGRAQLYADMIQRGGVEYAVTNLKSQFQTGQMTKEEFIESKDQLLATANQLGKLKSLGLSEDQQKAFISIGDINAHYTKLASKEKNPTIKAVYNIKAKKSQELMLNIANGTGVYANVTLPGGGNVRYSVPVENLTDEMVKSADFVEIVNDEEQNKELQMRKTQLGNGEYSPTGFYKNETGEAKIKEGDVATTQQTPLTRPNLSFDKLGTSTQQTVDAVLPVIQDMKGDQPGVTFLQTAIAANDKDGIVSHMMDIAEQATDPDSADATSNVYPRAVIDAAIAVSDRVKQLDTNETIKEKFPFITDEEIVAHPARTPEQDQEFQQSMPESGFSTPEALKEFLETGTYGVLTGENPLSTPVTEEANKKLNDAAQAWLKEKGLNAIPVYGKYGGNSERSFLVPNMSAQQAKDFANEFGQSSVAHSTGLITATGKMNPSTRQVSVSKQDQFDENKDFYSTIKVNGENVNFELGYDFDTETEMQSPEQELREVFDGEINAKADKVAQALKSAGITVQVVTDEEMKQIDGLESTGIDGLFDSEDGTIYLNRDRLRTALDAANTIYHEGTHPIINIIKNTAPQLYNDVVEGLKEIAKTNKEVAEVRKWAEKHYSQDGQEVVNDEFVVESIAKMAAGDIDINQIDKSFLNSVYDLLLKIGRIFGIAPKNADDKIAQFKELAGKISDALRGGKDISDIVGTENIGRFQTPEFQKRVSELQTDDSPVFYENAKKIANEGSFPNSIEFRAALVKAAKKHLPELKKIYGKDFDPTQQNETTARYMTDMLTKEGVNALVEHPEAIGWYDEKLQGALDVASIMFPEINTDKESKSAFILALAITSNGNKVDKNFDYAIDQYKIWNAIGKFDAEKEFGKQQSGIRATLITINNLLENGLSLSEITDFFMTKMRAGDLQYEELGTGKAVKMVDENVDEEVFAAAIIGSKIGNGFFMNLWGDYTQLTADRWFMRTWGRLAGDVLSFNNKTIASNKTRVENALSAVMNDAKSKDKLEEVIGFIPKSINSVSEKIENAGTDPHERAKLSSNNLLDELRKASNRYEVLKRGENDTPGKGSKKSFIRKVFYAVVDKIKSDYGITVSVADLQAAIWYPEKALYQSFQEGSSFDSIRDNYNEDEAPDYLNAAKKIARKNGITEEQINEAVSTGRRKRTGTGDQSLRGGEKTGRTNQEVLARIRELKGERRGERRGVTKKSPTKQFRKIRHDELPEDMQTFLFEFLETKNKDISIEYEVRSVNVSDLKKVYKLDESRGFDYADKNFSKDQLHPIIIIDGDVVDGFHRLYSYQKNGRSTIDAIIIKTKDHPNLHNRRQFRKSSVEDTKEFKLASYVFKKKSEGLNDAQIAASILSVFPSMGMTEIQQLVADPATYLNKKFSFLSSAVRANIVARSMVQDVYKKQAGIDPAFAGMSVTDTAADKAIEKGFKNKSFKDYITSFKNSFLDVSKGLPSWTTAMRDFATGEKNLEVIKAENTIKRLQIAAKKVGFKDWDSFTEALKSLAKPMQSLGVNQVPVIFDPIRASYNKPLDMPPALQPAALKALPVEIRPFVFEMRGQIDRLTNELITSGYVTPEQALQLEQNLGAYVNRSYKAYNEKPINIIGMPVGGYKPSKSDIKAAVKFIADKKFQIIASNDPTLDVDTAMQQASDEAVKEVKAMLDSKNSPYFGVKSNIDTRDTGILQQRQDIPEPIRKLLGEYTDPGTVFIMTVAKQAALVASSQYLSQLRKMGMNTLFYEKNDPTRPIEYSVEMAGEGSESKSPLSGLMTTPAIKEALGHTEPTYNALVKTWMKFVGAVRWGKTVGSIVTQFKNFESNIGFGVMNGLFLTGKNTEALGAARKYFSGQWSTKEIDELTEKVNKLGLVGQSIGIRELKDMFASGNVHDIALDMALNPKSKWQKAKKILGMPFGVANKMYRLGDDFWKVYAYVNERGQISEALYDEKYDKLTPSQQEDVDIEASERVKNTWPTYDRVVELAKTVSKSMPIFGNFLSFQAESVRVLQNSVRYAINDIKSPNKGFQAMGAKRLAGIGAYLGLRTAITLGVAKMAGIAGAGVLGSIMGDDDEDRKKEGIKEALPPWMKVGDLLIIPTKEKHKFTVYNLSSIDPYGVTFNTINALTEGSEDQDPGVTAAMSEFVGNFVDPEMTFMNTWDALVKGEDTRTGRKILTDSDHGFEAAMKVAGTIYNNLKPSTQGTIERLIERDNKLAEVTAAAGARPYDVDLHKSFQMNLTIMGKKFEEISANYFRAVYKTGATAASIEEARKEADTQKAYLIDKVNRVRENFILLGADPKVLEDMILTKATGKGTGFDPNTKLGLIGGDYNRDSLHNVIEPKK